MLWTTLNQFNNTGLTMQDKRILFRTRECLPALFEGFNDNCVLIHGNFCLRSMLKDSRSDQLLAMVGPGLMLWAPREYELFRLMDNSLAEDLLWSYLQRAPVAESFIWRRWLCMCYGMKLRNWLIPDDLVGATSIWHQNHSCRGSPDEPFFSHCQMRPSVS